MGQTAYDKALSEAKAQRQYQLGLAGTLSNVGRSGVGQAQSAYNLASQAGKSAIDAPFLPFNTYGNTVAGYQLPNIPNTCLLYTSPSPRDRQKSRMPSSA